MPLSARSAIVQLAVRLHRRRHRVKEGLFLAEGPDLVRHGLEAGVVDAGLVRDVLVTETGRQQFPELVSDAQRRAAVRFHLLDDDAMRRACEAVTPQPIAAICRRRVADPDLVLAGSSGPGGPMPVVALLVGCRDPGNLGTVIRLASAVGARGVCVSSASVDPFSPKAARATTGALFRVPIAVDVDAEALIARSREASYLSLATAADAPLDLFSAGRQGLADAPNLWVFGGESAGLEPALKSACDWQVSIPSSGQVESLNLATAAALCLYESVRVRGGFASGAGRSAGPSAGRY